MFQWSNQYEPTNKLSGYFAFFEKDSKNNGLKSTVANQLLENLQPKIGRRQLSIKIILHFILFSYALIKHLTYLTIKLCGHGALSSRSLGELEPSPYGSYTVVLAPANFRKFPHGPLAVGMPKYNKDDYRQQRGGFGYEVSVCCIEV